MTSPFYNPVWDPAGNRLHEITPDNMPVFYWNDACWHRCVPEKTEGMSYLDVGHCQGGFLLRFRQRGGTALGLEPEKINWVDDNAESHDFIGSDYEQEHATELLKMWYPNGDGYQMRYGGFSSNGEIIPRFHTPFTITSSFNVIEYMRNPKACVQALQANTSDRVLIATDSAPETCSPDTPPLRFRTSAKDLMSYFSWPCVWGEFDGGPIHGPQIFVCATNPESKLSPVDLQNMTFDSTLQKTETQRFYERGA